MVLREGVRENIIQLYKMGEHCLEGAPAEDRGAGRAVRRVVLADRARQRAALGVARALRASLLLYSLL